MIDPSITSYLKLNRDMLYTISLHRESLGNKEFYSIGFTNMNIPIPTVGSAIRLDPDDETWYRVLDVRIDYTGKDTEYYSVVSVHVLVQTLEESQ